MKRYFYISDSLDELAAVEKELSNKGLSSPQIHILSNNDAAVEQRHLNEVEAVLKKDVVHSMELGAGIGLMAAILVLVGAYLAGWTATAAGWIPFVFLAIVVLGFCTWEGGLLGIQEPHYQFRRFKESLAEGKHVLFIDIEGRQEAQLRDVLSAHPSLQMAGKGEPTPAMVIEAQKRWRGFLNSMP